MSTPNELTNFNQTLTLNKIICLAIYGNFALTLEQINITRQSKNDSSEIEKVSFQNVQEFFGPAGFFVDSLMSFFETLEEKAKTSSYKKNKGLYLSGFLFVFIILSYIHEKILQKFDKNIFFKILILGILSAISMLCKVYFKVVIRSIAEDYKNDNKKKALIIIGSIILSASLIYLNLFLEKSGFLKNKALLSFVFASLISLFCYSIFFEIFIYRICLSDLVDKIEENLKNLSWNPFSVSSTSGDKELKLSGKVAYLIFLFALSISACATMFFFEKYAEILLMQKFLITNQFLFLNFKEILISLISFVLIYTGDNIGESILDIVKDCSIKIAENKKIYKDEPKKNFIIYLVAYTLLAPILLSANLLFGFAIFSKILNQENFLTKIFDSIFDFNVKSLTIIMFGAFVFANICVGLLSFFSAQIQNNATSYIELNENVDSFFSIDHLAKICSLENKTI